MACTVVIGMGLRAVFERKTSDRARKGKGRLLWIGGKNMYGSYHGWKYIGSYIGLLEVIFAHFYKSARGNCKSFVSRTFDTSYYPT